MVGAVQAVCHVSAPTALFGRADIAGGADGGESAFELDGVRAARSRPELLERVMAGWFAVFVVPC